MNAGSGVNLKRTKQEFKKKYEEKKMFRSQFASRIPQQLYMTSLLCFHQRGEPNDFLRNVNRLLTCERRNDKILYK